MSLIERGISPNLVSSGLSGMSLIEGGMSPNLVSAGLTASLTPNASRKRITRDRNDKYKVECGEAVFISI
jgi:hypothetical protein